MGRRVVIARDVLQGTFFDAQKMLELGRPSREIYKFIKKRFALLENCPTYWRVEWNDSQPKKEVKTPLWSIPLADKMKDENYYSSWIEGVYDRLSADSPLRDDYYEKEDE